MYDSGSEADVDEFADGRDDMIRTLIENVSVYGADTDGDAPRLEEVPLGTVLDWVSNGGTHASCLLWSGPPGRWGSATTSRNG